MDESSTSTLVKYEIMFMFHPDLGEKKTAEEIEKFRNLVKTNGGKVYHEDIWGIRELAYKIKKQDHGFYAVFNFEIDPSHLTEMKEGFNIDQSIMRYLITKIAHNYELKTLKEYEEDAAKEDEEKAKEAAEKEAKKARKPAPKKPAAKKPAPKKAEAKAPKAEKKAEKADTKSSADLDNKLKSIIDDPDITL